MAIRLRVGGLLVLTVVAATPALASGTVSQTWDFSESTNSVILTRLARLVTFDPLTRAKETDAIANRLLTTALTQAAAQSTQTSATVAKFDRESSALQTMTRSLQTSTAFNAAPVLDAIIADRATQVGAISSVQTSDRTVTSRLAAEQASVTHQLATTLEYDSVRSDRTKHVSDALNHVAQTTSTPADKLAKQLALTTKLDEATESQALETELDSAESTVLTTAAQLSEIDAKTLTEALGSTLTKAQQLVTLTKLLNALPDATKPVAAKEIDALAQQIVGEPASNTDLAQVLKASERSTELQTKILDQLKEHADPATKQQIETLKQQAEQQREADKQAAEVTKKVQEQATEASNRAAEQARETAKQASEHQQEQTSHGTTSTPSQSSDDTKSSASPSASSSASSPAPTSGSTTNAGAATTERETIEVKVKDGQFDGSTSFALKSGTLVTVRFENDDPTPRTLTLSSGTVSSSISAANTTLTSFALTAPVTFTVSGIAGSGAIGLQ